MEHIYKSLLDTLNSGFKKKIIEDSLGNSTSNLGLVYKSIVLGLILKQMIGNDESKPIGLIMPNSVPTTIVFFAIQFLNRSIAVINFTSGIKNILSSIKNTDIKFIITSRNFINKANMQQEIERIKKSNCNIIYLEDIRKSLSLRVKISSFFTFFSLIISKKKFSSDKLAVILYTSGTESEPKGVGLSHKNLFANREQVLKTLKVNKSDKFFTCLPFFHSFGLGIGTLLPILSGCKVFLYPTPLHFQTIPKLLEETKASVFFSTDTFLKKYLPYVSKSTFSNIRYLIAGAEKVDEATYEKYENLNIRIFEGYGVTEASPAISVNTYENYKIGSVGKIMPGIDYKIEKIEGYDKGGLLYIKGENVINRYFGMTENFDWYNTGDVVYIDKEDYLFILGRLKRFAKIAGEMISLGLVESFPKKLWPENSSIVCSIKDQQKGESLLLITDKIDANLKNLADSIKKSGLSNLYVPKQIKIVKEFPILGSGKIDYRKLQDIADN
tara:strand:- start:954 stop:2447 length:1494 start_codon:yes stop_codon:yes gene_type:complete